MFAALGLLAHVASLLGGFAVNLLPHLLDLWKGKQDAAHELAMQTLQLQIAEKGLEAQVKEAAISGQVALGEQDAEVLKAAIAAAKPLEAQHDAPDTDTDQGWFAKFVNGVILLGTTIVNGFAFVSTTCINVLNASVRPVLAFAFSAAFLTLAGMEVYIVYQWAQQAGALGDAGRLLNVIEQLSGLTMVGALIDIQMAIIGFFFGQRAFGKRASQQ